MFTLPGGEVCVLIGRFEEHVNVVFRLELISEGEVSLVYCKHTLSNQAIQLKYNPLDKKHSFSMLIRK